MNVWLTRRIAKVDGCDLWGFCEVKADWAGPLEQAVEDGEGSDCACLSGTTGGGDRIDIAYYADRCKPVSPGTFELANINILKRVRAPLGVTRRSLSCALSTADREPRRLTAWADSANLGGIYQGDERFVAEADGRYEVACVLVEQVEVDLMDG